MNIKTEALVKEIMLSKAKPSTTILVNGLNMLAQIMCSMAITTNVEFNDGDYDKYSVWLFGYQKFCEELVKADSVDGSNKDLLKIYNAGFLEEYVWYNFQREYWIKPENLEFEAYQEWVIKNLKGHEAKPVFMIY